MLLRGATPLDFVGSTGVPLFAEFLEVDDPLPRAQQPTRLARPDYMLEVQNAVAPHRTTPARRLELIVSVRIVVATGRADIDAPDLRRSVIRILDAGGTQITTPDMQSFAQAIFPAVRKIVAAPGFAPNEPRSGTMPVSVRLPAISGQP
jgi:hypothetical protein